MEPETQAKNFLNVQEEDLDESESQYSDLNSITTEKA
jgi:hypothetical protein